MTIETIARVSGMLIPTRRDAGARVRAKVVSLRRGDQSGSKLLQVQRTIDLHHVGLQRFAQLANRSLTIWLTLSAAICDHLKEAVRERNFVLVST
jgi:hypothetical protein